MIKVLHAADLHLDSPFQALGRDKAAQRRSEQRQLLAKMGELIQSEKVDLALLAGDLFDADAPFPETARLLEQTLPAWGVPVFVAPGNHDWYGPRSPWARLDLGENVHVFTGEQIECIEVPELNVRVWGAAFTGKYRKAPLAGFEAEKTGDTLDIMVLHGEAGDPSSPYGPISEEDIARSGMDYVALGHSHAFSGLRRAGDTFYAWPGCPEGRGFDETGEKGVILAEVGQETCMARLAGLGGRRYEVLAVDLTDSRDHLSTVLDALGRDASRDIYRVLLRGAPETAPDLPGLQSALESRFFALELRDETVLRRDVWEGREVVSLKGLFLDGLWRRYEAAGTDAERANIELAARYGLQALERSEEPPLA